MSVSASSMWIRLIGVAAIALPALSTAQTETPDPAEFWVLGVGSLPEFEGSDDRQLVPFVVSRFSLFGNETEIDGLQARLDLVDHPVWRAGPALSLTIPRGDDVDALAVSMLPTLDLAAELGGFVGFRTPFGNAKEGTLSGLISARRDVAGVHDGWLVTGELEYFFAAARWLRFGLQVNSTYASSDYMQTYFGIDEGGSLVSGLPRYTADSGIKDVGTELYSVLSFSERSGVLVRYAYNRLLNDAADSPVVTVDGSRDQVFVGVGYFRQF